MSEPIATRTWIPLQDTPQVRATYKAKVHTASGVIAVMSAENDLACRGDDEVGGAGRAVLVVADDHDIPL